MRHESSTSARRASELEQAEQEAEYVRLLAEEALERAETAYRRAVTSFLRADERYLEALAAASHQEAPPDLTETLVRRVKERARVIDVVESRRADLEEASRLHSVTAQHHNW